MEWKTKKSSKIEFYRAYESGAGTRVRSTEL